MARLGKLRWRNRLKCDGEIGCFYSSANTRGYSSYVGEVSKAPENLVSRNFHADEPNRLWLTDITEFRLPGGEKFYLLSLIHI